MKLPNGARADLGTKIEDYVLNPRHWEGRHKARVFESVLGISLANQEACAEPFFRQPSTRTTPNPSEITVMERFTRCGSG